MSRLHPSEERTALEESVRRWCEDRATVAAEPRFAAERWRDRLLESDQALTELLAKFPQADAQRLRTLIRNAQKEKEAGKPPKNYRELFQALREVFPEP